MMNDATVGLWTASNRSIVISSCLLRGRIVCERSGALALRCFLVLNSCRSKIFGEHAPVSTGGCRISEHSLGSVNWLQFFFLLSVFPFETCVVIFHCRIDVCLALGMDLPVYVTRHLRHYPQ